MTDREVLRTHNDREMILRPHLWGRVKTTNFLFLKKDPRKAKYADDKRSAIVVRSPPNAPLTVYISGVEKPLTYETVDALLADGWLVD